VHPGLDQLQQRAHALATRAGAEGRRALLGVVGLPGAGKSTLAEALVAGFNGDGARGPRAAHVPMDGFHLADRQLARLGLAGCKGAPETFDAAGYAALLRRLAGAGSHTVYAPAFERDLEQPLAGALAVEPAVQLVVSEGNYLLLQDGPWPEVAECFDEIWFLDQDEDQRLGRLLARHVRFGKSPEQAAEWVDRVDQANAELIRPARDRADLVVALD
jgi:pantothenate kinase